MGKPYLSQMDPMGDGVRIRRGKEGQEGQEGQGKGRAGR